MPLALANGAKLDAVDAYAEVVNATTGVDAGMMVEMDTEDGEWDGAGSSRRGVGHDRDPRECIIDVREYDVPYYLRVAIDQQLRVGLWYSVTFDTGQPIFTQIKER